jgi:tRNA dimethylallyltransferase
MKKIVPIRVGPTGVGKTALSLILAETLPVEIVSADSRQIYKYLDIGTAKPDKDILKRIPHHFIDMLNPEEYFSAGKYSKLARQRIDEIISRNNIPLVVGGSGLYVRALLDGIFELEVRDKKVRASLRNRMGAEGVPALYDELRRCDPEYAQKITPADKQRIIRSLEVYIVTGRKFSSWHEENTETAQFIPVMFGLFMERALLYQEINERVEKMIEDGLLVEVIKLKKMGYSADINALNTVGYKEVFKYIDNQISFEDVVELIKRNSRRYAKRQLTWFNKEKRIVWKEVTDLNSLKDIGKQIVKEYRSSLKIDN